MAGSVAVYPQLRKLCNFSDKNWQNWQKLTLLIEVIEYASFQYNYFWNYYSFNRCENCERFCLSCNLSAFASDFNTHSFVYCVILFVQCGHPTLPPFLSEGVHTSVTFLFPAFCSRLSRVCALIVNWQYVRPP